MKLSRIFLALIVVGLSPLSFAQRVPQSNIRPPLQNPRHLRASAQEWSPPSTTFKATGSVDTAWVRHLGDSTRAYGMDVDAHGNVYITGYGLAGYRGAAKFRANGDLAWIALHGGSDSVLVEGQAIQSTPNGDAYVAVSFWDRRSYRHKDTAATIKYDSAGVEQWASGFITPGDSYANTSSLCFDVEGNIFVTGSVSYSKIATVKYDNSGKVLWAKSYHGTDSAEPIGAAYDGGVAVLSDRDGHAIVVGRESRSSMPIYLNSSYITIKYSPDGDTLWTRAYREHDLNSATAMAVDASGNIYLTGRAGYGYTEWSGSYVGGHFATIKYSPAGDTLWKRLFTDAIGATALAVDSSGDVYVTGYALTNTGTLFEPVYHGSIVTVKYNSDGDTLWTRRYFGRWTYNDYHPPEYRSAICLDRNGNVYVTGSPSVPSNAAPGLVTIKYGSSGQEEWTALYPPGSDVVGVQLDASENVYVVCTTGTQTGPTQSTVIKYLQSPTAVRNLAGEPPASFALEQNYPNPFNPSTTIHYALPHRSHVTLTVYNTLGQLVATLVNGDMEASHHSVEFDGSNLASGVYYYKLRAGGYVDVKKLLLVK